jgi:hypothetical protein
MCCILIFLFNIIVVVVVVRVLLLLLFLLLLLLVVVVYNFIERDIIYFIFPSLFLFYVITVRGIIVITQVGYMECVLRPWFTILNLHNSIKYVTYLYK